ncbi:CBS domain-containing protein [Methanothermococcus okinawensis]|uniref:Signal transduction protein with CBS domains n=1 Tax=Methanothermococcus okinawensis (strain DSM 14208 / JCM 11175 / IH1) TaxID=647113 RepID=F8ALA6_METOI|nr:CBS domain-containing protein [Methanothermococcus okinawensis]AEH06847.1 putative signal transduction protein with CBS domains [Methanothermococcus okinawensis IH1]
MELNISVSEAMSSPVETVNLNATAYDAANILKTKGIGCLVVVNDLMKPVGLITERDFVLKIVARNLKSKEVLVKDIASTKLIYVSPKATLMDAAKIMAEKKIKRLPVIENDELLGIITVSDITSISPKLFDIIVEFSNIKGAGNTYQANTTNEDEYIEGICEVCGAQGRVRYINGRYICDNCLDEEENL